MLSNKHPCCFKMVAIVKYPSSPRPDPTTCISHVRLSHSWVPRPASLDNEPPLA
jgi:hypothetical protein